MPEISNVTVLNDGLSDLLRVHGRVNGHKALILLDSGSTHDFVSEDFVRKHHLETQTGDDVFTVTLADGTTNTRPHVSTKPLHLASPDLGEEQTFTVFPLSRYDVILGKPWLTKNNPTVNYRTNEVKIGDSQPWVARLALDTHSQDETCIPDVQLNFISGQQARHALRRGDQGFLAYVTADESIPRSQNELDLQFMIQASPDVVQRDRLLSLLNEYQDVFPKTLPAKLPPVRQVNHEIDLETGSKAPSRAPYRLSQPQLDELQAQLTVLLEKGLIEPSKSPFGAPVFFVKKSDGSLRLVCDWRELNRITIKNDACLPNTDDLFDTIQESKFFTKLDLHSGYNQVRVRESDIPKTAINTPLGHFQYKVMGFGLCNAPATFMFLMNHVLRPYLRKCVVCLDDILIFSRSWEEHLIHLQTVLQALRDHELYCKPSKCHWLFWCTVLGSLANWRDNLTWSCQASSRRWLAQTSDSVTSPQFSGFCELLSAFHSALCGDSQTLDEVTGKRSTFSWNPERESAFKDLKTAWIQAPVLQLADVAKPFKVHTDASDGVIGAVLLQELNEGWHPVAYVCRKLNPAERNYTITEKETLAVVYALKCWRLYLFKHFDLYTDNQAVVYLRSKPHLRPREARWVEFLADFYFTIHHIPGKENTADPLTRQTDFYPELNSLEYLMDIHPDEAKLISEGYGEDPELSYIIKRLSSTSKEDALHTPYL